MSSHSASNVGRASFLPCSARRSCSQQLDSTSVKESMESFVVTTPLRIRWRRLRYQTKWFTQDCVTSTPGLTTAFFLHNFEACTEKVDDGVAAFFLKTTHVHASDVDPCSQQDLELSPVTLVTRRSPKASVVITSYADAQSTW